MAPAAIQPKLAGVQIWFFMASLACLRRAAIQLIDVAIFADRGGMRSGQHITLVMVKISQLIMTIVANKAIRPIKSVVFGHVVWRMIDVAGRAVQVFRAKLSQSMAAFTG